MSNICYMLVGVPGSGKSTAANDLLKEMPHLISVSTDEYIENMAKKNGKTYNEVYRDLGDESVKWMNNQIKNIVKAKESFIWDQTNVYESSRRKKINMLKQNKYEVIAIAVELSNDELEKRLNKRIRDGGKKISTKIIEEMLKNYTRPHYEEGFLEIYLIENNNAPCLLNKKSITPIYR